MTKSQKVYERKCCREFGLYLKKQRSKAKRSQAEIAKFCGYSSAQFISNIESGKAWPPMDVLIQFSEACDIDRGDLLVKLVHYKKRIWSQQLGLEKSR